ncbi:MAG TPA: hypothetical protein VHX66_03095 [Solirubrobacteraceae bacterium]|nr:hypothetical protein [Solirubrobacteraceae bacterium]
MAVEECVDEWSDRAMADERMPELGFAVDRVSVAAPVSGARDVSVGDKVAEDLLDGALTDAHAVSDLADPDGRVLCDAEQQVAVVAEEDPTGADRGRHGGDRRRKNHGT